MERLSNPSNPARLPKNKSFLFYHLSRQTEGKSCQRKAGEIMRNGFIFHIRWRREKLVQQIFFKVFSCHLDLYIDFMMSFLSWGPMQESDMQQFCVEMMKRLDLQRRNEQFCDVVLEVGSGDDQACFKAHRIVLCAGSPFFYNALNSDMKEKREGVIRLENTSKAAMEELIDYLYTGHVDVTQHNAFDLLEMADFFVIPSLKDVSSKFIAQTLSSSSCLMAYYSAVKYHCAELHKEARNFICTHFMSVVELEDFLNLSLEELEEWISSDELKVKGEEDVFQAIVKWLEGKDCRERERFFELFRHVRLLYMSRNYVFKEVVPHPLVKNDETCTAFVIEAMKDVSSGSEECYFAQPPRNCLKSAEDCLVFTDETCTICYLPTENRWYDLADQPENLYLHSMCASYGNLYINNADEQTIDRYDPVRNSWAPVIPSLSCGQMPFCSVALVNFQGFLYVIGGIKGNEDVNSVYRYSPDINVWQEDASMSISRSSLSAVADKETMYAIGGRTKDQLLDVVERFDPKTNSWCKVASILKKKSCCHAIILRDKVFLFGGFTSPVLSSGNIEMYDPISNMWTAIQSTSAPERCFDALNFKGAVLVAGSWNQENSSNILLRLYDVDKNEWKTCAHYPLHFSPHAMAPLRIPRVILNSCQVLT